VKLCLLAAAKEVCADKSLQNVILSFGSCTRRVQELGTFVWTT